MNDIRGYKIDEGDGVFFNAPGHYKDLSYGTVVGFTPKMVRVRPIGKAVDVFINVFPDLIGVHCKRGGAA